MAGSATSLREHRCVRITAKVDYALRAAAELAAAGESLVTAEAIAERQDIPTRFLRNILQELRAAGIVLAQRGPDGGYGLARPADEITVAEIIRAVEGPLAAVQGRPPGDLGYHGAARGLDDVWVALRVNLRAVLDAVSLDHVVEGRLPPDVAALLETPGAFERH